MTAEQRAEARAAALAASTAAFGRHLVQERELRGLSRDEVARLTKLPPAIVEALESGDPGRMPPSAYVQGYLRSYAAAVGLDADDVVLRWQEVAGAEDRPRRPARAPVLKIALAALAVALLVALAALTLVGPHERREASPPPPAARDEAPLPPPGPSGG